MIEFNDASLLLGETVEIYPNVNFTVPRVKDVIKNNDYDIYTSIFTTMTRQIFSTAREVDRIESEFPNLWFMLWNQELNISLGSMFRQGDTLSDIMLDALSYWTGLEKHIDRDGENFGFKVLTQQKKIIHLDTQWVINEDVYNEFSELIKVITNWNLPEEFLPPQINSDEQHKLWLKIYNGRLNNRKMRSDKSWGDRILLLSTGGNSYIPLDEISEMTIFTFNELMLFHSERDAYDMQWMVYSLPDIDRKNLTAPKTHWKEKAKIRKIKG